MSFTISIIKTLRTYEITSGTSGNKEHLSKIVLQAIPSSASFDIEIIEEIPKNIAESTDDIQFLSQPIIIDRDPIVKWNVQYASKDDAIEVGYIINKKIKTISTETIAAGKKSSFTSRFFMFILNGGWIVIIVIVVILLFVLPSLAYIHRRKKKLAAYKQNEKEENSDKKQEGN